MQKNVLLCATPKHKMQSNAVSNSGWLGIFCSRCQYKLFLLTARIQILDITSHLWPRDCIRFFLGQTPLSFSVIQFFTTKSLLSRPSIYDVNWVFKNYLFWNIKAAAWLSKAPSGKEQLLLCIKSLTAVNSYFLNCTSKEIFQALSFLSGLAHTKRYTQGNDTSYPTLNSSINCY